MIYYLLQKKYVGNVISYDCIPGLETFLTLKLGNTLWQKISFAHSLDAVISYF